MCRSDRNPLAPEPRPKLATTFRTPADTTTAAPPPGPHRPQRIPRLDLPGSTRPTHDITTARQHVRPARYPATKAGLPTLTDKDHNAQGPGSASSPLTTKPGEKISVLNMADGQWPPE